MISWKDIIPLSEVEEIECLPAIQSFLIAQDEREYKCYCGVWNLFCRYDVKGHKTLHCRYCRREWCFDHVDASLCRITKDKAVLHELTI